MCEPVLCLLGGQVSRTDMSWNRHVLSRIRVPTPIRILCLGSRRWCRRQGFPRHLGGLLTRQREVAVIAPKMGSVFAAVDENAAGPCSSDACVERSESGLLGRVRMGKGSFSGGARMRNAAADLEDQNSLGTVVVLSVGLHNSLWMLFSCWREPGYVVAPYVAASGHNSLVLPC